MDHILEQIDAEIEKLQQVRIILSAPEKAEPEKVIHIVPKKRKHVMSAAGRKAISDAAKMRWKKHKAEAKKAA